jgi:hypothetical protein
MAENFSKLELIWRTRKGGGGGTQRIYLDFVVNGQSLHDLLTTDDHIGCLGWLPQDIEQVVFEQLTTGRLSDLGNDRYAIYVCAECGDIGCGAITVQIEKTKDGFVWKNFGYENDYDESMQDLENYKKIGEFHFKEAEYQHALTSRPALK